MSAATRTTLAWQFHSDLSQEEMQRRLDAKWPRRWTISESAYFGDFVVGKVTPEGMVRVYETDDRFVLQLKFESSDPEAKVLLLDAQQKVVTELLPTMGARDVMPTDPID